jgi:hypothetical protein
MLTAGLVAAAVAALPVHVVEAALAVQLHVLVSPPLQQLGAAAAHAGWPGRGAACSSCRMHLSRQRRSRQSRHCAAAGHTPRHTSSASHQHRQRKQTKRSYEEELSVAARAWAKPGDEVWCIDKARFEFEYPLEHSQPASQPSQPSQPASQPAGRLAGRPAGRPARQSEALSSFMRGSTPHSAMSDSAVSRMVSASGRNVQPCAAAASFRNCTADHTCRGNAIVTATAIA